MDREIAEVVQEFLRQVGIDVRIDFFEWATTSAILREAEIPYHLTSQAFYTANGDADFALFPNFHSASLPPAGWNRAAYANADVDAWLEQAQTSLDDTERLQLYAQVQEQLAADLPAGKRNWETRRGYTQLPGVDAAITNEAIHARYAHLTGL